MGNDGLAWQEFSDPPFAERIRELVQQKVSMARQVGMDFGDGIVVGDGGEAVSISTSRGGMLMLQFGNRGRPGYRVIVRKDGTIRVGCTAEPPALEDQIALMWRLPVGPPERSVFGVIEQGGIQTIFVVGESVLEEGIYYPPGLNAYVRQGHTLLPTLRVPQDANNEVWNQWFEQFCVSVKRGVIVRLGERIRQFPHEVYAVWQNRQGLLLVEGSDGKQPPIAEGWYDFWHPREEYPGQLSIIDWGEADMKQSIRDWVV